ncbi:conserved hypothetical protein [Uncinocarpus reesii 1704]|uniref:Acid phosphatase n=1 Tax=Uncinocarpus reesii (strain UAMH 1704) TaxID=336963 RepID=C4JIP5_UNCRE|nr:uncharacterized protein UREG_02906 [Uncinocarpus reesii 1704]EEP78057.1 conserved hypothetical protein [Uncinocarpus reesii 1704]
MLQLQQYKDVLNNHHVLGRSTAQLCKKPLRSRFDMAASNGCLPIIAASFAIFRTYQGPLQPEPRSDMGRSTTDGYITSTQCLETFCLLHTYPLVAIDARKDVGSKWMPPGPLASTAAWARSIIRLLLDLRRPQRQRRGGQPMLPREYRRSRRGLLFLLPHPGLLLPAECDGRVQISSIESFLRLPERGSESGQQNHPKSIFVFWYAPRNNGDNIVPEIERWGGNGKLGLGSIQMVKEGCHDCHQPQMTTLLPREAYSKEELEKLYPRGLELQLVQVFLRHGERTPVSARFQNLRPARTRHNGTSFNGVESLKNLGIMTRHYFLWGLMPVVMVSGKLTSCINAHGDDCTDTSLSSQLGELTDKGRQTTLALGRRLRNLYIDQLGYMPPIISNADHMYLRSTPIPRALESLQQTFWGMYPASARTSNFVAPTIVQRNNSEQMEYLNSLWSKWMPESSSRVAVNSRPRLSGIFDTINSTMAHGPLTRLPSEFYDLQGHEIADKIAMDEWFAGYRESREYRKLGIGALMGDIVDRMVATSVSGGWWPTTESKRENGSPVKFAISGCHDTTIAAILTSLGAFDDGKWPPYTANITIELFKDVDGPGRRRKSRAGDILEELSNPVGENNGNNSSKDHTRLLWREPPLLNYLPLANITSASDITIGL